MAGLHVLALLGLWRLQAWQDRGPPAPQQAPLIVWLQGAPRPAAPDTPRLPRPSSTALPSAPALLPPMLGPASPQAITLPAPAPAPAEHAAPTPARPASAPLNLALPRGPSAPWRQRNPALDDPRSNDPKATLDSRIAAALGGSDQITEYRLEDGSVRFKRGNSCVIARPNRASTLDPFNASAQQRPRLLDSC